MIRRLLLRSTDYWIPIVIILGCLFYAVLWEIFPTDWFMTARPYKKNSQYVYKRSFNRLFICDVDHFKSNFENYLEDPDTLFNHIKCRFKVRPQKRLVALVKVNDHHYLVKRYNCPNFWRWIKQFPLRAAPAFRSWHYGHELGKKGILSPKPIMYIQKSVGPFWTTCYTINEFADGLKAEDFFKEGSAYKEQWPLVIKRLAKVIDKLNANQIIHGDLNLDNIIISNGKPYLIDLDRMHIYHLDHTYYKRRYKSQHVRKIARKLKRINPEVRSLYLDQMNLIED